MTCNQIVLLLHIKRGTIQDNNIGTHYNDLSILFIKGLVIETKMEKVVLSDKGKALVGVIESITNLL